MLKRPLVSYLLGSLGSAGIRVIHAVVGYERDSLIAQVRPLIPESLDVRFVENPDWRRQNGLSVLAAAGKVKSPFLLTMCDHLFDNDLLDVLLGQADPHQLNLAVDRKLESIVDIDDAMKVQTEAGQVVAIGKDRKTTTPSTPASSSQMTNCSIISSAPNPATAGTIAAWRTECV